MVYLLVEVTWHPSLSAAGSLQSLIILLSQHLPDKRAGREHPGYLERLIKSSKKESPKKKRKERRLKLKILFNVCM